MADECNHDFDCANRQALLINYSQILHKHCSRKPDTYQCLASLIINIRTRFNEPFRLLSHVHASHESQTLIRAISRPTHLHRVTSSHFSTSIRRFSTFPLPFQQTTNHNVKINKTNSPSKIHLQNPPSITSTPYTPPSKPPPLGPRSPRRLPALQHLIPNPRHAPKLL